MFNGVNASGVYRVERDGKVEIVPISSRVNEPVFRTDNPVSDTERADLERHQMTEARNVSSYLPSLKVDAHAFDEANATRSVQHSAHVVGLLCPDTVSRIKADLQRREKSNAAKALRNASKS